MGERGEVTHLPDSVLQVHGQACWLDKCGEEQGQRLDSERCL